MRGDTKFDSGMRSLAVSMESHVSFEVISCHIKMTRRLIGPCKLMWTLDNLLVSRFGPFLCDFDARYEFSHPSF